MLNFVAPNDFDAVINMFYSFGFFETDDENEKVLSNFFDSLKVGGKFLMHTDVNIPRILSGKYKINEIRTLQNGSKLRIIDQFDERTKRVEVSWTFDGVQKDYSVRVYTKEEFESLCLKVGFQNVQAYSNWNGDYYSEDSEDMIVVGTK